MPERNGFDTQFLRHLKRLRYTRQSSITAPCIRWVSQRYQRRMERTTICDVVLTEVLDIIERLELFQQHLDSFRPEMRYLNLILQPTTRRSSRQTPGKLGCFDVGRQSESSSSIPVYVT
jgi:hypothetical protein